MPHLRQSFILPKSGPDPHHPSKQTYNPTLPTGLRRYQQEGDDHFITFSCYHRLPYLNNPISRDLFLNSLEQPPEHFRPRLLSLSQEGTDPMNTATTITIAVLTALTPTVTCLIGIILTRQDVRDLRGEMSALRTDVQHQLDSFRTEIRTDMLAMRKDVHADLLMIHERVANVEGRQGR